jgi:hypothetical protein
MDNVQKHYNSIRYLACECLITLIVERIFVASNAV